jgi:phosphatidate cytidylyltransferase
VEGCIGGLLVNMAVSAIIYYTLIPEGLLGQYGIIHMLILSVILAVNGQAGDIAESVFKRYTGVKNSSNLLSEHGGALDRIDSAMFNAPVLFLYLKLVLHI